MTHREKASDGDTGDGAPHARHFINHMALRYSQSGFEIDLMQIDPRASTEHTCCRLVTTPDRLQCLHSTVSAALERYVARFGPIPGDLKCDPEAGHG